MKAGFMKVKTDKKPQKYKKIKRKKEYIPCRHSTLFGGNMIYISFSNSNSRTKKNSKTS